MTRLNETQALVLGFFLAAWLSLVAILAISPSIYQATLKQLPGYRGWYAVVFLALISALIGFLALGVLRKSGWLFWLILIAFAAGVLRLPTSLLELLRILDPSWPASYLVLQAVVGVIQAGIAFLMFVGYRRQGIWGSFRTSQFRR
jgi:hypothetical protein